MAAGLTAPWLSRDGALVFAARGVRTFAYGFLSVLLAIYLVGVGYSTVAIGAIFGAALAGDAALTLLMSVVGDTVGRRRSLMLLSLLMVLGGVALVLTRHPVALTFAAFMGVVSVTSAEASPFIALDQSVLAQATAELHRTRAFAWYNVIGSSASALGALFSGLLEILPRVPGVSELDAFRASFGLYAALGLVSFALVSRLSGAVEVAVEKRRPYRQALQRSRGVVFTLAALFSIDALGGGFVVQSLVALFFHEKFGLGAAAVGALFFGSNLLAAASFLAAAAMARQIGLINTMVFTHLPSNVLLMLVAFAPTAPLAVAVFLARQALSQMDVPTRQSYVMGVVDPDERVAAAGVTALSRNFGQAASPALSGWAIHSLALGAPFVLAGALKIVYDLTLLVLFRRRPAPEEVPAATVSAPPEL